MEQAIEGAEPLHRVKGKPGRKPKSKFVEEIAADRLGGCDPKAAAYAVRVWNGQSPDLPIAERIERVVNALRGQNLLTTGLTYPPLYAIAQ